MFDRAAGGRVWFDRTLPDRVALGRPGQIAIGFARRASRCKPGRFRTRIFANGVNSSIQVHYRALKVKEHFKESRALRTETTVNDPRHFAIGRRVTSESWDWLVNIGHQINPRLLSAQLQACPCALDVTTLDRMVSPSTHDGLPAPALRLAIRAQWRCSPACAPTHTCSQG